MQVWLLVVALLSVSSTAFAQLGNIGGALKKAPVAQLVDDMNVTDAEERQIGDDVSLKVRRRFGVVQDPAIHKYVSLVGMTLAKQSERPNLSWTFIVLDTDGVNAFAAPGGLVHITRGALALAKNEAELAGVLGHEIGHVVRRHTVNAIKKSKMVKAGTNAAGSRASVLADMANRAYEMVLENNFDRGDELDADKVGVQLTQKAGYAAAALGEFLLRIDERNKGQAERNGMFASHPQTEERIAKIRQGAAGANAKVLVEPRFKQNVKYLPVDLSKVVKGSDTPVAASSGFGAGGLKTSVAQERQSTQVSSSGGVRGLGADRAAKGGSNPGLIRTNVAAAELDAFRKGIA